MATPCRASGGGVRDAEGERTRATWSPTCTRGHALVRYKSLVGEATILVAKSGVFETGAAAQELF